MTSTHQPLDVIKALKPVTLADGTVKKPGDIWTTTRALSMALVVDGSAVMVTMGTS